MKFSAEVKASADFFVTKNRPLCGRFLLSLVSDDLFGVFVKDVDTSSINSDLNSIAGSCGGLRRNSGNKSGFFTNVEVKVDFSTHKFGNFYVGFDYGVSKCTNGRSVVVDTFGTDTCNDFLANVVSQQLLLVLGQGQGRLRGLGHIFAAGGVLVICGLGPVTDVSIIFQPAQLINELCLFYHIVREEDLCDPLVTHGLQGGDDEIHPQILNGGDICKYQEAVKQLKEQDNAEQNRQDLQATLLFLLFFLGFFRRFTEMIVIFDGKCLLSLGSQGTSYHIFPHL